MSNISNVKEALIAKSESLFSDKMHNAVNCFGFPIQEFITLLSVKEAEIYEILMTAFSLYLEYEWNYEIKVSCSPNWDERNKASKAFCNANKVVFDQMFLKLTGLDFPTGSEPEYKGIHHDIRMCVKESYSVLSGQRLYDEICAFANVHHTLQQSMMRVWFRYLEEKHPELDWQPGTGYDYIGFPMI